jgi:DNA-binding transcriptional ArsR family regulator
MTTRAATVIHPVRLRVCAALRARAMTTTEIAAALPDVPIATLYRHVRILYRHRLIEVVARRRVNGIVEPTYALKRGASRFKAQAFAEIPSRDHMRYVGVLAGTQIAAAELYFSSRGHDVVGDGATYMLADLPLTDAEARRLRTRIQRLLKEFKRPAGPKRRVRHVAVSALPDPRHTESGV